ncbi:MAG TPA: hypothetical protein VGC85_07080 [Chthoniobacterales bacterium]
MSDPTATPSSSRVTRPFVWSIRRELWENKSLYIAPLIVAGVVLFGWFCSMFHLAERRRAALLLDEPHRRMAIEMPYGMAAMTILITAIFVGVFYCLDALYGERRDRSILFWKSLPVSDLTTILSKASIPLLILPVICFITILSTQLLMLLMSSAVLLANGLDPMLTWRYFWLPREAVILLYALVVLSFWHAPLYSWFILVSSWVRHAAFLCALLPFILVVVFERITFGSAYFWSFLKYRIGGFAPGAFSFPDSHLPAINSLSQLTAGRYLSMPGLWVGLIIAVLCLAGAVRMRRYRGPI